MRNNTVDYIYYICSVFGIFLLSILLSYLAVFCRRNFRGGRSGATREVYDYKQIVQIDSEEESSDTEIYLDLDRK